MRIRLAFAADGHDASATWLVSAVDEYTEDEHGHVPDWHRKALDEQTAAGNEVREVWVDVPDEVIEERFESPNVRCEVEAPRERDERSEGDG